MQYDIIVIGGGIAGLSAGLTAARAGRSVAIVTGGVPGGELLNIEKVDGVPGHEDGIAGYDLAPIAQEQAANAGAELVMDEAESLVADGDNWVVATASGPLTAKGIVLATGAHLKKLGVPGEDEFAGRGVSHCATCDGPLLRGKVAVVAGGGDSALQEALTLAQHCSNVVLVEQGPALTAQRAYVELVEAEPKIEVMTGRTISTIEGEGKVERVTLDDGTVIEASGTFAFIGLAPNVALAAGLVDLATDGRIATDGALRSSARGIVAAGNCRSGNGWRAASAMGDGASAVATLGRYIDSGEWG
ncbi:MAG: FAD-dependent oxidoreductase [Croceibacterium sp.]